MMTAWSRYRWTWLQCLHTPKREKLIREGRSADHKGPVQLFLIIAIYDKNVAGVKFPMFESLTRCGILLMFFFKGIYQ